MKIVHLIENVVSEIIPTYALPVEKWYGVEFAAQCVEAPDNVQPNWTFDAESRTFLEPKPVGPSLAQAQDLRIAESKTKLAEYLESHPLTWTDGKKYSVTEDKQSLLTGNLAAYQLAVTLGQTAELTWNATGEVCEVWTFQNLAALAIAIKAYVKPLVAYQQTAEVAIMACTTAEDVSAVSLDYGSVSNA